MQTFPHLPLCSLVPLLSFVASCSSDDKTETPPQPVVGTMVVTGASAASENTSYEMRSRVACTRNADTGRLDIEAPREATPSWATSISSRPVSALRVHATRERIS